MSGVSGVSTAAAQYSAASANAGPVREHMDPSQMAERMQEDLNEKLTSAGVSEEDGDTDTSALVSQISEQVTDLLFGIDEEV